MSGRVTRLSEAGGAGVVVVAADTAIEAKVTAAPHRPLTQQRQNGTGAGYGASRAGAPRAATEVQGALAVIIEKEGSSGSTDYATTSAGNDDNPSATAEGVEGGMGELRPPDGGWGWMVALGSFIVNFLVISQTSCFSILFSRYLLGEGTSSVTTAWIYNTLNFVWHLMGPLVRPLAQGFGWRPVGFFGVFLCSTSCIISAFTTSPEFLFFSFSILSGVGGGLAGTIAYIIVAPYFEKHRGRANTFMVAGPPLGQIVIAPLMRILLDEYGFRGATLIYGAIIMNSFAGVALFHPLKWHLKLPRQEQQVDLESTEPALPRENISRKLSDMSLSRKWSERSFSRRMSERSLNRKWSEFSLYQVPSADGSEGQDLAIVAMQARLERKRRNLLRFSETSCQSLVSGDIPFSAIVSTIDISGTGLGEDDRISSHEEGEGRRSGWVRLWQTLVQVARSTKADVGVLRQSRAVLISLSFLCSTVSFLNMLLLMPFAVQAAGFTLQDAAWCFSLMGLVNMVVRLLVSPMADWPFINLDYCLMLGFGLKAAGLAAMALTVNLSVMLGASALYGVGLGSTLSLQNLLIIQVMGLDHLAPTFGVVCLLVAVGCPCLGPLIGLLRDVTDSYSVTLWVMAALDIFSILLWLLLPSAAAFDAKRTASHPSPNP